MTSSFVLAPCGLLCDLLALPERARLGTRRPTFGWIVNGGRPGPRQTAYEIMVARSEAAMARNDGDLWSTGKVEATDSLHIPYAGVPLDGAMTPCWKVRTWAGGGEPSPWSEPQRFRPAEEEAANTVSVYPLETARIAPARTVFPEPGTVFFDFGKQAFGWLEIETETGTPEAVATVRLGERLRNDRVDRTPEGTIRYAETVQALPPGQRVHRIALPPDARNTRPGSPEEEAPPAIALPPELGVVLPFRYAEVDGLPSGARAAMVRVQYPFDEAAASFRSSDPALDALWELCRYTMLATSFAGYYVDGDRERIPYEADAYINQLSHYAVDREYSLARRTHEYLLRYPTWPTEWKQHSILLAWADYEATGDRRSLERTYDTLKTEKLLLPCARPDGLLDTGALRDIVDWPPGERDGYEFRPVNTVINAFHVHTLRLMARMARALGHAGDAGEFETRGERAAARLNDLLFDASRDVYLDGEGSGHASLHANLFPLAFGLVAPARRASVVAWIKSQGMACSVYPAQFLLEGLFEAGEDDYAVRLMTGTGLRSWGNMLRHGATLTWEAWDQTLKPNQDWNHAWGAAPGNIIARYVLGVRPAEPGYGKVRIRPQLGPLRHAEGTVPTIRGPIRVRAWRDEKGEIAHEASVPANVDVI